MEQIVRVYRTFDNGTAEVIRERESACSGDCHQCSGCGSARQTMLLTARNPIGAREGDKVVIESSSGPVLKAAAILYILPLALFLAGFIVAENLWKRGILGSIAGFLLGMLPVKLLDRHMTKKGAVYTIRAYAGASPSNDTEKGDNEVD